jgi:hypothetical protein
MSLELWFEKKNMDIYFETEVGIVTIGIGMLGHS